MKLDQELIKAILKYVEEHSKGDGRVLAIPELPGYDECQIAYNIKMCDQAGFLEVQRTSDISYPRKLTWPGQMGSNGSAKGHGLMDALDNAPDHPAHLVGPATHMVH